MTEFEKYIQRYLDLIPSENWLEELKNVTNATLEIYSQLSEEQSEFAYAEGKWTLKVLLEHLIDTEKIFNYRALRFARNDKSALTGFDEELFAKNGIAEYLKIGDLIEEYNIVRLSTIIFFSRLKEEQLSRKGLANNNESSVETIGKLVVGHNIHHLNIIKERYLPLLK